MSFPNSPTNGQVSIINGANYTFSTATNSWTKIAGTITATTQLSVTGNIASTSTTTGGLTVTGGLGVGGTINAGAIVAGGVRTTSSSTPPANPTPGDMWYNTTVDSIYRYTTDGTTSAWMDITGPAVSNAVNGANVSSSLIPTTTGAYDLGSSTNRFRTLYVTSSTIDIGGVPISAAGGTLAIGGAQIATTATVSAYSGPKVSALTQANSSYTTNTSTAVATTGGYIVITGAGFQSGAQVIVGTRSASAVGFVSSNQLNVQVPAQGTGTYVVYVSNPDGGVAISVPGLTYNDLPVWSTGSTLPSGLQGQAVSIQLAASDSTGVTYSLAAGSTLPTGLTLSSSGLLSGTVTGLSVNTVYTFTVNAVDTYYQATGQTFTISITVGDAYITYTPLLLNGETSTATYITDVSTSSLALSVAGSATPNRFSPLWGSGYYSNYFDGSTGYLSATSTLTNILTGNYTVEAWVYLTALPTGTQPATNATILAGIGSGGTYQLWSIASTGYTVVSRDSSSYVTMSGTIPAINTWNHIAFVYSGTTLTVYLNGISVASTTLTGTFSTSATSLQIGGGTSGGAAKAGCLQGYISNLRVINGTAVYTSNFTPPTAPLTAITGTSLLTCLNNNITDSSTNAFAITKNGTVNVVPNQPFGALPSAVQGYGSGLFDGSTGYVSLGTNSSLNFGTSNFTVEFWAYPNTASQNSNAIILGNGNATWSAGAVNITMGSSLGKLGFAAYDYSSSNPNFLIDSTSFVANQWTHYAITRNGNTFTMYRNGISVATTTAFTGNINLNNNNKTFIGGGDWDGSSSYFNGYISNLRIVNTVIYTTNFTPPTAPLAPVANTTLLTLQNRQAVNNSIFQDDSPNNFLLSKDGTPTQGTFSPFSQNGWSNYFNGNAAGGNNGSYLGFPASSAFSFAGDFTVEFWVNLLNNQNTSPSFYIMTLTGPIYFAINMQAGNYVSVYLNTSSPSINATDIYPALNTWTHIALVRQGSTVKLYINGVPSSSTATNSSTLGSSSTVSYISQGSNLTACYVSNFRIVNGTAVYTSAFTPPTAPLTAIPNTSVLTCQSNRFIDNSTNALTLTPGNSPQVQAFSPFSTGVSYSPTANGGSYYLNSADIYAPASNAFLFSGNFTIEFWLYMVASSSNSNSYIIQSLPSSTYFAINAIAGNSIYVFLNSGSVGLNCTDVYPVLNAWTHIAMVRNGSTIKMYVNGVASSTTASNSSALGSSSQAFYAGCGGVPACYMSGIRVVNGAAVYTTNFTPPTAPPAPVSYVTSSTTGSTSLLMLGTNAGIIDQTARTNIITTGTVKTESYTVKYGSGAVYFDGSSYLTIPYNLLYSLTTGNWTVEGWIYPTSLSGSAAVNCIFTNGFPIQIYVQSNTVAVYVSSSNSSGVYFVNPAAGPASSVTTNTWSHFAVVKNGSNYTVYVNGVAGTTVTSSTAPAAPSTSYAINVATYNNASAGAYYTGYIDDLRITNGVARYTTNFTPPATGFLGQ